MSAIPDPVRWHNGLLVTPTSQQHLARRFEALIQALPGHYHPYFWGVTHVDYAVEDLKNGELTVRALDAVMRNGLQVTIRDRAPLRLRLEAGDRSRLLVSLGMRRDEPDTSQRFVPCTREGAEPVFGEDEVEIPFQRTRLDLYTGTPPATIQPDLGFPLCEIQRDGTSFRLTDFTPPTLRVAPDSALGLRCASIPAELRAEADAVTDRMQINAIVAALPAFEVLLAASPHPFTLYLELCRLAGAVAVLRNHTTPPQFAPYAHDQSRGVFDKVVRFVRGLADDTAGGAVRRCTFDRDGIWFRLRSDPGWTDALATGDRSQMILAMETDAGDALAQRWAENCVIGTTSAVKTLLARRVRGMARRRISPGSALPARRNVHLFRITPDAEAARSGEDLLVLAELPPLKDLPGVQDVAGLVPTALDLYVVDPPPEPTDG